MQPDLAAPQGAGFDRRSFLKLGLAGSALLSAGGMAATLAGCSGAQQPPAQGYAFLRDADVALFSAILPVLLDGMPLTPAMKQEALLRIDGGCVLAQPAAQGEVRKLFDLLNTGLLRRVTTGVGKPWNEASADEIRSFLDRWCASGIGLFNAGYRALVKFACVAYFGQAASRQVSGYPGPLASMYQAVNA